MSGGLNGSVFCSRIKGSERTRGCEVCVVNRIYFHVEAALPSQRVFIAGEPVQVVGYNLTCFPQASSDVAWCEEDGALRQGTGHDPAFSAQTKLASSSSQPSCRHGSFWERGSRIELCVSVNRDTFVVQRVTGCEITDVCYREGWFDQVWCVEIKSECLAFSPSLF